MNLFEEFFAGKATEEISVWYKAACSDLNSRSLHGTSDKDEDVKKYEALTDEQKRELDTIYGATMSLHDPMEIFWAPFRRPRLLRKIRILWQDSDDTPLSGMTGRQGNEQTDKSCRIGRRRTTSGEGVKNSVSMGI